MGVDEDIAASLPEPPPPAPARRDAAIEAALRRFDGDESPAPPARTPQPSEPWWRQLHRPQLGALVSAALVALVGVPAVWLSMSERPRPAENAVEYAVENVEDATPDMAAPGDMPAPPQIAEAAPEPSVDALDSAAASPSRPAPQEMARADMPPPAMMVPPPSVVAAPKASSPVGALAAESGVPADRRRVEQSEKPMVMASRGPAAAPPAPAMALEDSADHSIVVTGSRVQRKSAGRGDWNACTVNDPSRSLRGCGSLVNPGAKGEAGRTAAHVSDGLSRAWKGDMDGAISAFDQAIAASPRNAFAYLNRGLARQRSGDADGALADLDQAARLAPRAARVYYNRSLVLRERGDTRRARVDENRALGIDPSYEAVVQ